MQRGILLGILALVLAIACSKDDDSSSQAKTYDKASILSEVSQDVILPAHKNLANMADEFLAKVKSLEANPAMSQLTVAQTEWIGLSKAYRSCEVFDLGEVANTYIHRSFSVYPANKSQIESYIQDNIALDAAFFESAGSNTKGLFSMEYLIYNENGNQAVLDSFTVSANKARRIEYLVGLAENMKKKADELELFWTIDGSNYAATFEADLSDDINGSMSLLVNSIINLTERIAVKKLGKPLGKIAGTPKNPELFRQYRSKTSWDNISSNYLVLRRLIDGGTDGIGLLKALDDLGAKSGDVKTSDLIRTKLEKINLFFSFQSETLEEMLVNDEVKVEDLYQQFRELLLILKTDVADVMSITIKISDSDGD